MARVIINGTLSYSSPPNPIEIDFDPTRGTVFRIKYQSAGDNLAGLANAFYNERIRFQWTRGVIKSTLEAEFSGGTLGFDDSPQANWQMLGNEIQKSIFESSFAQGFGPGVIGSTNALWNSIQSGDINLADLVSSLDNTVLDPTKIQPLIGSANAAGVASLLGFLIRGQTHFAEGQYVLKRTLTISNFFTGDLPGEAAETLLTTGEILGLGMPPAIAAKVSQVGGATSHPGFLWSWRQLPSTMITSAANKIEVSTEWWFDEWSTDLYRQA